MKKNLCRGLVLLGVLIFTFLICEKVLMLKSEDGIEQVKSFYLQKEDTIDVLLVGSSHIYCNVNTGQLWDEYGMSAFNLGGAEQPYWNSYYYIKEALKTQTPKVIVLNATIPGIRFDDYQAEVWLNTNIYGMKWNKNRIDNTNVSSVPESFWRILFPMNSMHGRYSDLKKDDFIDKNYDISYKGFDYRNTVQAFDTPDISNVTECSPITEKQENYLRKIIELTKEKNIPLVLVSVPFIVNEEEQKYYNYEFKICEEEGVDYIDFNKLYNEMGLDFTTDMAEELHLNISGSKKFTGFLGQLLVDKYNIPDHRGDAKYASWDKDALIHRQEFNGEYMRASLSINEYLTWASNENYLVFISSNTEGNDGLSNMREGLTNLGILPEELSKVSYYVVDGEQLVMSSDSNFRYVSDQGPDRLIYEKTEDQPVSLFIDTDDFDMSQGEVTIFVYDKVLNEPEGYLLYSPTSDTMMKFY